MAIPIWAGLDVTYNKKKHGIDFEAAQALCNDPHLLEVEARSSDEPRFFLIGMIEGKHWSAIVT